MLRIMLLAFLPAFGGCAETMQSFVLDTAALNRASSPRSRKARTPRPAFAPQRVDKLCPANTLPYCGRELRLLPSAFIG